MIERLALLRSPGVGRVQGQARELCRDALELIEQLLVFLRPDVLAHGRERVGHRVQHAAFALQQDRRGQVRGVRIFRRFEQVERYRPIRALGHPLHERQLLSFRADGHVERHLTFDDGIGATLESDRVRNVANRGVRAGDIADRHKRAR